MSSPFDFALPRPSYDAAGRRVRPCLKRGAAHRRIIKQVTVRGVEYSYHATKGWRASKA